MALGVYISVLSHTCYVTFSELLNFSGLAPQLEKTYLTDFYENEVKLNDVINVSIVVHPGHFIDAGSLLTSSSFHIFPYILTYFCFSCYCGQMPQKK